MVVDVKMDSSTFNITTLFSWYIILPALCTFLYWHYTKTFNHWKNRKVFYLEPVILFGNIKDRVLFRKSFHEFQLDVYIKLKGHKIAGFFEGRRPTLMCLDPDIIRHILVKDFDHFVDRPTLKFRDSPYIQQMLFNLKGENWKSVRNLMTPAFSSGKLKAMQILVQAVTDQLIGYLEKSVETNGEILDFSGGQSTGEIQIKDFFGRFTVDVIATCAFGVQCDSFNEANSEFVKIISAFTDVSLLNRIALFAVMIFIPRLSRFLPLSFFNMPSINFLGNVIKDAKKHRGGNPNLKRNDFLQLMLDAENDEQDAIEGENEKDSKRKLMTEDTIVAQSILFLLAGFETSSTLLTFVCYELALNMEVQDKLRSEIVEVFEKYEGELSYQALGELNYLENVLLETLRKHPPVARIDRNCTQEYTIPGTDLVLNVGDNVSIPIMGLHYDPEIYPEPQKFNPDRFNAEEKSKRSQYVFLPFGAGPRNCIGLRFAIMTSKLVLAHLLKDYKIQKCSKTAVPYVYSEFSMLLKPKGGIWLAIDKI